MLSEIGRSFGLELGNVMVSVPFLLFEARGLPRYFFHTEGPEREVLDHEGSELPGMKAMRAEASEVVRELVAASIKAGRGARRLDTLRVVSGSGQVVYTLPFEEVLSPVHAG